MLPVFVRFQYRQITHNSAQDHIEPVFVDAELGGSFSSDPAGREQLDQILVKRVHSLADRRFDNALEQMEVIRLNRLLHSFVTLHYFQSGYALAINRRDQALANNGIEVPREQAADIR